MNSLSLLKAMFYQKIALVRHNSPDSFVINQLKCVHFSERSTTSVLHCHREFFTSFFHCSEPFFTKQLKHRSAYFVQLQSTV